MILIILISFSISYSQKVSHPSQLKFKPLKFEPPDPLDYRIQLNNGMIIYIKEDHKLPLFQLNAYIRAGSIYDPKDKIGLAELTGSLMRTGGTKNMSGDEIDETLDFIAANINIYVSKFYTTASISSMAKDIDEVLKIYADILMNPVFDEQKIKLRKEEVIDAIKRRNDNPRTIVANEFNRLLYKNHPLSWLPSLKTINNISREDMVEFHRRYFAPNNMIIAIASDFNKGELLQKIKRVFSGWNKKEINFPVLPDVDINIKPGVYMIQKNINQGFIRFGHFGVRLNNPDIYALRIMNFILGGGSFTSRITTTVRSNEGLSYSQGSRMGEGTIFPGLFYCYVQTKSSTVPYAIYLILKHVREMTEELVLDSEMETARNTLIERFPEFFSTAFTTMNNFAKLEFNQQPFDYYKKYRDRIKNVTKEDVLRVAKKYLHPDNMIFLIVGDIEKCKAGGSKYKGSLEDFGKVNIIQLESSVRK